MNRRRIARYFFVFLFFSFTAPALAFSPHYIVSDAEFVDSTAWTLPEIRQFLETKQSPLASYAPRDVDGTLKKAAEIIATAGRKHQINPKVLLVLLQKEQSLVDGELGIKNYELGNGKRRLDWATGYGVCDDCRTNDPLLAGFRGFAKQVDFAAQRLRYFFDHPNEFRIRPNRAARIDRQLVTPLTRATASLYLYTPHISGNRNFWIIWNRWFEQRYPDGVILKNKKTEELWYISGGRRRKLSTALIQQQLASRAMLPVLPEELVKYRIGKPLSTPPFAVLRTPDGSVWLLGLSQRRRLATPDVLRTIGFHPEEIESVEEEALKDYPQGPEIRDALDSAAIRLVKSPSASTVYLLDNGAKRAFTSANVFQTLGYSWEHVLTVGSDVLEQYPSGAPIELSTEEEMQKALKGL